MKVTGPVLIALCIHILVSESFVITAGTDAIPVKPLEIVRISDHAFVHVSYHHFTNTPNVAANGLVLASGSEAVIIDTPWTDKDTEKLIKWVSDSLHASVTGVIATHSHIDCMGGIGAVHSAGILSYACDSTCSIARSRGQILPKRTFKDSLTLAIGGHRLTCYYLGGGHATDNIVVWIPDFDILFGGCLMKATTWKGLGNLRDADLQAWPVTLEKVRRKFPANCTVIPGHGPIGGMEIVDHTLDLLEIYAKSNPAD
ncbi:subclass B1 metallo-beta-lactamase [bacterium]|nr:subclass B1 metallo-beta-lactamase [bacterium]